MTTGPRGSRWGLAASGAGRGGCSGPVFDFDLTDDGNLPAGRRDDLRPAQAFDGEVLAQQRDLGEALRDLEDDGLRTGRRHGFDAARTGSPTDALDQVAGAPELAANGQRRQFVAARAHQAQRGRIADECLARLDVTLRVGLAVVQRHEEPRRALPPRQRDAQAAGRVGPRQDVAVQALAREAVAENRWALHQRLFANGRRRRRRFRGRGLPRRSALGVEAAHERAEGE